MDDVSTKNRAALVKLCHENHKAKAKSGGSAVCACGYGGGGTPECSALKELFDAEQELDYFKTTMRTPLLRSVLLFACGMDVPDAQYEKLKVEHMIDGRKLTLKGKKLLWESIGKLSRNP